MKHYFGIAELAEHLHIKPSTLYAWVELGRIPHLKLGRLVRFDPDEVDVGSLTIAGNVQNHSHLGVGDCGARCST